MAFLWEMTCAEGRGPVIDSILAALKSRGLRNSHMRPRVGPFHWYCTVTGCKTKKPHRSLLRSRALGHPPWRVLAVSRPDQVDGAVALALATVDMRCTSASGSSRCSKGIGRSVIPMARRHHAVPAFIRPGLGMCSPRAGLRKGPIDAFLRSAVDAICSGFIFLLRSTTPSVACGPSPS
jgi:hypothetical protein